MKIWKIEAYHSDTDSGIQFRPYIAYIEAATCGQVVKEFEDQHSGQDLLITSIVLSDEVDCIIRSQKQ